MRTISNAIRTNFNDLDSLLTVPTRQTREFTIFANSILMDPFWAHFSFAKKKKKFSLTGVVVCIMPKDKKQVDFAMSTTVYWQYWNY